MDLTGIHHLTAISAVIRENYRFYTGTLGMRLVKRSVNQDDVSAYHLFYSDAKGSPGSDVTFFDWPMPRESRGTRAITRTHLRVAGLPALQFWAERLRQRGVATGKITQRDGRPTLDLEDPEDNASPWWTMGARERRIRGSGAQCRPNTSCAGSGPSSSACPPCVRRMSCYGRRSICVPSASTRTPSTPRIRCRSTKWDPAARR